MLILNIFMYVMCIFVIYLLIRYIKMFVSARKTDNAKPRPEFKKIHILYCVLAGIGYIALGTCISYCVQPTLSSDYAEKVNTADFYSETECNERAMLIEYGDDALDERIRIINYAKESLIVSTFDLRRDNSGTKILALLYEAADRGVHVQLLVDGFHGRADLEGTPELVALSSHPNAEVKLYNPVNCFLPWTLQGRMHDKYIIADDDVYILGGRNISDYFLGDNIINYDRDVLIYSEGHDGSIQQLKAYFSEVWNLNCSVLINDSELLARLQPVRAQVIKYQKLAEEIHSEYGEAFFAENYNDITVSTNKVTLISNPTHMYAKEPECYYTLTELMLNAESVMLHTPYLMMNDYMYERLFAVGANIPEFKLTLNSVANGGNPFGCSDYMANKAYLIESGASIYEYDGGLSYHAKTLLIDKRLCVVGSFNMDMRSCYIDTELMLAVDSRELADILSGYMQNIENDSLNVKSLTEYALNEGQTAQKTGTFKYLLYKCLYYIMKPLRFLI